MPPAGAPVPVGVFDSGVGGLSVLRAIRSELPGQPVLYLADQAHVPYGRARWKRCAASPRASPATCSPRALA